MPIASIAGLRHLSQAQGSFVRLDQSTDKLQTTTAKARFWQLSQRSQEKAGNRAAAERVRDSVCAYCGKAEGTRLFNQYIGKKMCIRDSSTTLRPGWARLPGRRRYDFRRGVLPDHELRFRQGRREADRLKSPSPWGIMPYGFPSSRPGRAWTFASPPAGQGALPGGVWCAGPLRCHAAVALWHSFC